MPERIRRQVENSRIEVAMPKVPTTDKLLVHYQLWKPVGQKPFWTTFKGKRVEFDKLQQARDFSSVNSLGGIRVKGFNNAS